MTIREITVETAVAPYDIQIVIENEDGSTLTMPKAHYEAQQVEHLTEIPTK
jgi:hypothetical protein